MTAAASIQLDAGWSQLRAVLIDATRGAERLAISQSAEDTDDWTSSAGTATGGPNAQFWRRDAGMGRGARRGQGSASERADTPRLRRGQTQAVRRPDGRQVASAPDARKGQRAYPVQTNGRGDHGGARIVPGRRVRARLAGPSCSAATRRSGYRSGRPAGGSLDPGSRFRGAAGGAAVGPFRRR